jgi:hypothetical protein
MEGGAMNLPKSLTKFIANKIDSFESELNEAIKAYLKDNLGLTPTEVEFRGGLFEAGFGGHRSEVEVNLTFLLPIQFEDDNQFVEWHDSEVSDSDLDKWGFGDLINNSISHHIWTPYDPETNSCSKTCILIKLSESSCHWNT